jgi:hypothetical protein
MITLKLGEVKEIVSGLNQVMGERLPVKTAYSFTKLAKTIQNEYRTYEESRMKLIHTYSNKDENGKPSIVDGEYDICDKQAFAKEFSELSNIDVEIDFNPISINDLGDAQISPVAMIALEKFVGE